jgi:N-acetylglucosaminyl-diphospho-decaprenol L-rhamnosyltransferase
MRIGAVVVHFNQPLALATTLHGLMGGSRAPDALVIVDNDSAVPPDPDDLPPGAVLLRSGINGGYGYAVNKGVEYLLDADRVDAVLVLTHETIVEPAALALLEESMPAGGGAVVGPILVDQRGDGDRVWSAGGAATATGRAQHLCAGETTAGIAPVVADVDWIDGAAILMPIALWLEVGGLAEEYFMYFEDMDLCRRVHDVGGRVLCDRRARAAQHPGGRTPHLRMRNGYYYHRVWSSPGRRWLWLIDEVARLSARDPRSVPVLVGGLRAGRLLYSARRMIGSDA